MESMMADDPNKWTDPDNSEEAEIRYLVEHTDVSPQQAKELVAKHGANRDKLLQEAKSIKAEG